MKIKYVDLKMGADRLALVQAATLICEEYAAQNLSLTLRQVYYQFVARGLLPNEQKHYKRLGEALNDARMAGLFDWDFIVDRTRNLVDLPHWRSPADLVEAAATQYRIDLWKTQRQRIEVWIEKDAGIGVIEGVCRANDVPYFSCRGYTSASEMWVAAQRIGDRIRHGERVTVLHVGDHDPSGLDMTRDIGQRLSTFLHNDWYKEFRDYGCPKSSPGIREDMRTRMRTLGSTIGDGQTPWVVKRIALTREQIEQYEPPPNPAKTTDSRFEAYVEETGLDESWELDALDPSVLSDLISREIDLVRNRDAWTESEYQQERDRALLTSVSEHWADVTAPYRDQTEQER